MTLTNWRNSAITLVIVSNKTHSIIYGGIKRDKTERKIDQKSKREMLQSDYRNHSDPDQDREVSEDE